MKPVKLLSVASEVYPIIKTGGLADVAGALPAALAAEGVTTRTLIPGYPAVTKALQNAAVMLDWPEFYGGAARLLAGSCAGLWLAARSRKWGLHAPRECKAVRPRTVNLLRGGVNF